MSAYDLHGAPCCYVGSELQWENQTISAAYWFLLFFFSPQWKSWYVANVCYPTSITPRSTRASSDSHAAVWSRPLPLPPYLPLQALPMDCSTLPSFYFLLAILSCQFTNHGLQDACLPKLLYATANPTNMESVHLYRDFVVLPPLSTFLVKNNTLKKVRLFQTYIA